MFFGSEIFNHSNFDILHVSTSFIDVYSFGIFEDSDFYERPVSILIKNVATVLMLGDFVNSQVAELVVGGVANDNTNFLVWFKVRDWGIRFNHPFFIFIFD